MPYLYKSSWDALHSVVVSILTRCAFSIIIFTEQKRFFGKGWDQQTLFCELTDKYLEYS